jgi:hypothetical protein
MNRKRRRALSWIVMIGALAMQTRGDAQVPPHQPGTICFTPSFWCWMQYPGIPGRPCFCPSPWGPVAGYIG